MRKNPHIMIVEARFYDDLTDELVAGAVGTLEARGCTWERIAVPGAFEIPGAIRFAIDGPWAGGNPPFDGYIALGVVIRGETSHYDYVCGESARGLQELALTHKAPIGYGILTVENGDQAWKRARRTEGNKGRDAAEACLAMIDLKARFS